MNFSVDFGPPESPILKLTGQCPYCGDVLIEREWDARQGPASDQHGEQDALIYLAHVRACPKAPAQTKNCGGCNGT